MLKSDIMPRDEIVAEIQRAWKFNPYKIEYEGSSINRFSSEIDYECLNCNHVMHTTFSKLEDMWDKHGWYCPKCKASFNPVYEEKMPHELVEMNPDYVHDLDAEYAIMSRIGEELGCTPYEFKSLNKGFSVRLQHKACSSIFTATPSMIYRQFKLVDKYSGEDLVTPYCPKCNQILAQDGVSYSGSRFLERLHNWYEDLHIEFPYTFSEDAIYRFKDYGKPIVVTCAFCNHVFTETPENLFKTAGESTCPVCDGEHRPEDSGDGMVSDVDRDNREKELMQSEMNTEVSMENDISSCDATSTIELISESPEFNIPEEDLFVGYADKPLSSPQEKSEEIVEEKSSPVPPEPQKELKRDTSLTDEEIIDYVVDEMKNSLGQEPEEDSNADDEMMEFVVGEQSIISGGESVKLEDLTLGAPMESKNFMSNPENVNNEDLNTNENDLEKKEDGGIVAVETDVDALVENLAQEMREDGETGMGLETQENHNESLETRVSDPITTQSPIIDNGGYPLEYTPTEVSEETPDFANPPMVHTPENDALVAGPDDKPETFEEITESMNEIFEDLNMGIKATRESEDSEPSDKDDDDDPNFGIPDIEPEDEDPEESEVMEDLRNRLGEERIVGNAPVFPLMEESLPTAPFMMPENQGVQPTQPTPQVDMIPSNQQNGINPTDLNWNDIWGSL